jgi:hypothetical protein
MDKFFTLTAGKGGGNRVANVGSGDPGFSAFKAELRHGQINPSPLRSRPEIEMTSGNSDEFFLFPV